MAKKRRFGPVIRKPKPKKTRPTTKWSNIKKQILSGTFSENLQWQKELREFFGKRGKPLKHKLRSEEARKRFNELVHRFNVERPTAEKMAKRAEAIREKQKAHVRAASPAATAEAAVSEYEKMVDILQAVHDDIMSNIRYAEIIGMMAEYDDMTPEEIAKWIMEQYEKMKESLPSFADPDKKTPKDKQKAMGEEFSNALSKVIAEMGTYDMDDLVEGLGKLAEGDKEFKEFIAARKAAQETKDKGENATKAGKDRGAGSTRNKKKPGSRRKR